VGDKTYNPASPKDMCNKIFYTAYFSTETSRPEHKLVAQKLSEAFGNKHRAINFEEIYNTYQNISKKELGFEPKFKSEGGSSRTD